MKILQRNGENGRKFIPTSEGFYDFRKKQYIYQYKDQVGNVRLSYWVHPDEQTLKVLDYNDYYPFGMNISQNSEFSATASPLNYKFGGKELQESGMYDFGARVYMPDVARWFNIDPLAELSPDLTPFRYGFNNPISFTDPTGMYESGESEGICDCYLEYPHETTLSDMAGFQTDLESEFREEMSEGMEGPDRRKQRDIEEEKEINQLTFDIAREKADVRNFNGLSPDEVPVNFFGTKDEAAFHQVFNQMYNLFKDTKGDGVFRVYSHGNFGTLFNGEDKIRDAKTFDSVMNSKNSNWKNVDKMKDPILILYACLSGISTTQNEAMGKQISKAHPNLVVIAFTGFVTYNPKVSGIKNINAGQDKGDSRGAIVFYQNGEYLTGYRYSEFLTKYPNFK